MQDMMRTESEAVLPNDFSSSIYYNLSLQSWVGTTGFHTTLVLHHIYFININIVIDYLAVGIRNLELKAMPKSFLNYGFPSL